MVHTETKECKQCGKWYVYTNYIDVAWHEEKPYHCIVPKFNNKVCKICGSKDCLGLEGEC